MFRPALLWLAVAIAAPASAQPAVYGSVGTTGLGLGLGIANPKPSVGLRVETNIWRASADVDETDVDYSGRVRFRNVGVYGDWFPFEGNFRISAGVAYNRSRLDASATGSTVRLGGTRFALDGEQLTLTGRMPPVTPYVGIGFGIRPARGWGFFGELGAYFGKPTVSLTASPGLAAAAGPELEAERIRLQDEADRFSIYPVLRTGVVYRF